MAVTSDIVATYRGPGRMAARMFAAGRREDRALIFCLLAGLLLFVAQAPYQARMAALNPEGPLAVRLYWSAFFWLGIVPLALYAFAGAVWLLSRLAQRRLSGYAIRLSLFWSLVAASPLALLAGMVAGLIGESPALQLVGLAWLAVFGWFWASALVEAERSGA